MTRRDLALQLLHEAGSRGVTTGEFIRAGVGSRYGARLKELRDSGHTIEAERVRDGEWRYTLRNVPEPAGPLSGEPARAGGPDPDAPGETLFDIPDESISAVTGQPVRRAA